MILKLMSFSNKLKRLNKGDKMKCAITGVETFKSFKGMPLSKEILKEAREWADERGMTLRDGILSLADKYKAEDDRILAEQAKLLDH